jgi:hypothetical protein
MSKIIFHFQHPSQNDVIESKFNIFTNLRAAYNKKQINQKLKHGWRNMQSIDDANETAEYYPRMNANERE